MAYSRAQLIDLLREYARRYGIDERIAIAQINQESRFNPVAWSGKANGIAQFTPATAQRFGVDVWDVNSSFDGWGRYMRWLLDRFHGSYPLALAGYNAGEGNVDKYGGIPPFPETQDYVRTILNAAGSGSDIIDVGPTPLSNALVPAVLAVDGQSNVSALHLIVLALVALYVLDASLDALWG